MPESSTADTHGAAPGSDEQHIQDGNAASSTANKDVDAGSSPAKGAETMLAAVQSALKPESKESSPDSQTPEKEDAGKTASEAELSSKDELSPDEVNQLKPKTQKAFRRLTETLSAKNSELESIKPKIESYERLNSFVTSKGLSEQDVANGFEIMGNIKQHPEKALPQLEALVAELRKMTGKELPADLAEQVRLGYVSEPIAHELAEKRAQNSRLQQTSEQQAEQQRQEQALRAHTEAVNVSKEAGTAWETAKRQNDPDWHLKQDRIHEILELELRRRHAEGKSLPNKDDTVKLLDDIHARVTKEVRKFNPKPGAVKGPVEGQASTRSVSEPKSYLEAVQAGMRAAAG